MNNIKISVIIPIYNLESCLSTTLESVINQTHKNLEIILVDDGSTDGSLSVMRSYAERDERIKVISKQNGGVSSARNAGLDVAAGDYVGFVDGDDVIEPDMYEYMLAGAVRYSADLVQCGVMICDGDKSELVMSPNAPVIISNGSDIHAESLRHFSGSACCKLFSAKAVKGIRFKSDYSIGEDMLFSLEALSASGLTVLMPEGKYRYMQRISSATHSLTRKHLTSYAEMLVAAEEIFKGRNGIMSFLLANKMQYAMDTCSRLVLSKEDHPDILMRTRIMVKNSLHAARRSTLLSAKDKLKLSLIAHAFPLYKIMLRSAKGRSRDI